MGWDSRSADKSLAPKSSQFSLTRPTINPRIHLNPAEWPVFLLAFDPGFTHALLLDAGRMVAAGPIADALTAASLSRCFGLSLTLERRGGRWLAWSP